MVRTAAVLVLVLTATVLPQQARKYTVPGIDRFLEEFARLLAATSPEEDCIDILQDIERAYAFIAAKGDALTAAERNAQGRIVVTVASALAPRTKRLLIRLESARTLGVLGDVRGARPLRILLEDASGRGPPNRS